MKQNKGPEGHSYGCRWRRDTVYPDQNVHETWHPVRDDWAYYSLAINPDFDLASSLEHVEYVKNKEKELPKQMRWIMIAFVGVG